MSDEYDVEGYTDEQLFQILDLNNPSDRELEAKILSMVRKYTQFGNASGDKLSQFFIDIYNRFFDSTEEPLKEGMISFSDSEFKSAGQTNVIDGSSKTGTYDSGIIGPTLPANVKPVNIMDNTGLSKPENGVVGTANMGNKVTPSKDNVQLTKPLDYSKDSLNPLLKQTIKRIISIDSQYRNQQTNSPSTNFTFDLSEPLRDVVSLSLYSVQIPYTWYTVNSDFGGNFFYLKGNVPGINNGQHDYKIEIPSGNYTPSGLATAVNTAIKTTAEIHTDVSFGNTKAIYNNGIADQSSGTGKCAIQVDITKVYNEGNFTMTFPNWSSPLDNTLRLNTLAGYLGFNNQEYYCSSIYSSFFFTRLNSQLYPITTTKNSFKIVPYVGNSYLTADVSYTPITVSLNITGLTQVSISSMVTLLHNTLIANTYFDNAFTSCSLIDISNAQQYGNQKSYVKFSCKLNNNNSPIVRNLKLAAVFPYDPSGSLFYGSDSFFEFSKTINDSDKNVVCEFNEIVSESPILQSYYDASNTSIEFRCTASGYDNSYNNLTASLPNTNYTLTYLITATNIAINSALSSNSHLSSQILFYSDTTTSYLKLKTRVDNNYFNADYSIYATTGNANLPNLFGLPNSMNYYDVSSVYHNANYLFTGVTFSSMDTIYIIPKSPGNKNALPFIINLNTTLAYSNGATLANYLNSKISNYRDPVTGLYPLGGSSVVYDVNNGFTLNLNITLLLNQNFYEVTFNSANSIWSLLTFNTSVYKLIDYSNNDYTITSNSPIKDNQINIYDGSNNVFYLTPSNSVNVFNTSGNSYLLPITIPDNNELGDGTYYAINDLLNAINSQLVNTIADGTTFTKYSSADGQTFIKIRFNINKVFTTADYKLVFYDPYSFTSCFSNKSKSTTTSIQNATWDTTLGWLLGYREQIYYNLGDYVDITNNGISNTGIYYLINDPNVCVLIGDTNVSTNLYNYFLIMLDDYVQNHLNDGLVTITNQETSVSHGPYITLCDPVTGQNIIRPADYGNPGVSYTAQELNAFNQQVQSHLVKSKTYSKGPFVKDIFGIIPVKTSGMAIGSVYVEFGGSLQNQQRLYFGPVNIHRMTIRLLNDRGNLVDLNNANWSFSFICEQLYKSGVS